MDKSDWIKFGAEAQTHFQMKSGFKVEFAHKTRPNLIVVLVDVPTELRTNTVSDLDAIVRTDEIELERFFLSSLWAGYSKRANILIVRESE